MLKAGGTFLYCAQAIERQGMDQFIALLQSKHSFALAEVHRSRQLIAHDSRAVQEMDVPESYQRNPLASGDEAQCFLHFNELHNPYKL